MVRETFGVASALVQAQRASDPAHRAMMARIAEDELGHAALAWAVGDWLSSRLDDAALARVEAARRDAIAALCRDASVDPPASARDILGLPGGAEATAIVERLASTLWS